MVLSMSDFDTLLRKARCLVGYCVTWDILLVRALVSIKERVLNFMKANANIVFYVLPQSGCCLSMSKSINQELLFAILVYPRFLVSQLGRVYSVL